MSIQIFYIKAAANLAQKLIFCAAFTIAIRKDKVKLGGNYAN